METSAPQVCAQPADQPSSMPARAAFHQQNGQGSGLPAGQKIAHYSEYSGVLGLR